MAKVNPLEQPMQVDVDNPQNESDEEDKNEKPTKLKKKIPSPFNKYYPNKAVQDELERLNKKVEQLKVEKRVYKDNIKWILKNIGTHTIGHNVIVGNDGVIVDNGEGEKEDLKNIMARHFTKVTCEHAAISKELATLKNIVNMSSKTLEHLCKRNDKKLGSVVQCVELLELTMSSDEHFTDGRIDRALLAIQKWTSAKERTLTDLYKAKGDQIPKESLSTVQFIASKCVNSECRKTLQRLLDIDPHVLEDNPSDQDMCFRGLVFWRQKDTDNNNAGHLKRLLMELDKATLESRKQESQSILKLKVDDLGLLDGADEDSVRRMNSTDIKEILEIVKSISQKLATTEHRDLSPFIYPDDAPSPTQPIEDVHKRVRTLSVRKAGSPTFKRRKREDHSDE